MKNLMIIALACSANMLFAYYSDYGQTYGGQDYGQSYGQSYGSYPSYQNYGYYPQQGSQYYPQQGSQYYPQQGTQYYPQQPTQTSTTPTEIQQPQGGGSLEQQHPNLIVMFTKDVCPYCQYMKPIMDAMMAKYGNQITIMYADITQNPQYVQQYGFSTVPHVVYFKNGKVLESHGSGNKTMTAEQVEEKIKMHFGDVISGQ